MKNINPKAMMKFTLILILTITILSSWTCLNSAGANTAEDITPLADTQLPVLAVPGKMKITPLEKKDIIILKDGKKIEGKSSEVRVIEIKYLDAKGKMPVKILSIKRQ
jgi:hypothetical protein